MAAKKQGKAKRATTGAAKRTGTPRREAAGAHESDQRARLKGKLSEAIEQVDAEGLLFLLRQANVLIHNQKVDEVNRELAELAAEPGQPATGKPAVGLRLPASVTVEDSDNKSAFFVAFGNVRKVLNLDELKRLVRICYGAESKSDALRQLFTVLARERSDILHDAGIRSAANPLIEGLFNALRAKYRLEDR